MATQTDKLFLESSKPIVQIQSNHNLTELFETLDLERGSFFEIVFKLVLFFNSLPGIKGNLKTKPEVPLRESERLDFCSPQLFKLMSVLKSVDHQSRRLFMTEHQKLQDQHLL